MIHQRLDMTPTLMIAGHRIGHYSAEGKLSTSLIREQIGKDVERKSPKPDLPSQSANPAHCAGFALSHRLNLEHSPSSPATCPKSNEGFARVTDPATARGRATVFVRGPFCEPIRTTRIQVAILRKTSILWTYKCS